MQKFVYGSSSVKQKFVGYIERSAVSNGSSASQSFDEWAGISSILREDAWQQARSSTSEDSLASAKGVLFLDPIL